MPKTLLTLRTNAKALADMANSSFVTDAQWDVFINSGYKELYDILLMSREDYFESEHTDTTVSGTTDYALPTDFYKLLDVDMEISGAGGDHYTVEPYANVDRNRLENSTSSTTTWAGLLPKYRVRGGNIRFLPEPPAGLSIRLKYIPVVTELSGDSSELSDIIFDQWAEYIEVYAVIRALQKEERDTVDMKQTLMMLRQRIDGAKLQRDQHLPKEIRSARAEREFLYDSDLW